MPVQYVIDKAHRLVITSAWGLATFGEFRAHQETLLSDPDFNPDFNQLLDATRVTAAEVSGEQIKTLASRTFLYPTSKRAFVASQPAFYGLGRMAQVYHSMQKSSSNIQVFNNLRSALNWLGLKESDIRLPMPEEPEVITRPREQ